LSSLRYKRKSKWDKRMRNVGGRKREKAEERRYQKSGKGMNPKGHGGECKNDKSKSWPRKKKRESKKKNSMRHGVIL